MSEEYGPDFITITDEDGNDIELEFARWRRAPTRTVRSTG